MEYKWDCNEDEYCRENERNEYANEWRNSRSEKDHRVIYLRLVRCCCSFGNRLKRVDTNKLAVMLYLHNSNPMTLAKRTHSAVASLAAI
jgi:hypothetical protein